MNKIKGMVFILFCLWSINLWADGSPFLPPHAKDDLASVYSKYQSDTAGKNADYIPELAKANPAHFGIAIATVDGQFLTIGDAETPFAIESISKPFVYMLALQDNGEKLLTHKVGLNPTGHRFNSITAIEERPEHLQNPLVNAGAIQVTSLIKGKSSEDKWQRVLQFLGQLSDGRLFLGQAVYQSEIASYHHNKGMVELLNSYGMISGNPHDALIRYTKACSVMVTAKQLAIMGATLANNGKNPITQQQVISPQYVRDALSQMTTNGLYDNSGAWWWAVGLPAKSGVGGGIVAVVPGKMAIVVFSPPLDQAGNSVRAQDVITALSKRWKLHLLDQ